MTSRTSSAWPHRIVALTLAAVAIATAPLRPGGGADVAAAPLFEAGVVTDLTWGISATDVDRTVSSIAGAGAKWVRLNVNWAGGEPDVKGVLNEGYLLQVDLAVRKAVAAGLQVVMPVSDGVPYWASADPAKRSDATGKHYNQYWKPTAMGDYAAFVGRVVARYAPLGVHTYEVWNEPNLARFWPSGVNAAEYAAMLAATAPVIRANDASALIVSGGLSKNDYPYLEQMYAAGAAPHFDAVGVHPYVGSSDPTWCWNQGGTTRKAIDAFCSLEEIRSVMVARGDSAKSVWLTEFGWSTTTAAYGVSEAQQADFLTKGLEKIRTSYPFVRTALWYAMRNNYWQADNAADFEANFGLLRTDFTPKPAHSAFKAWTASFHASATSTTSTSAAPTTTSTTVPATTTTTAPPTTTTTVRPTTTTTAPALVISNVRVSGLGTNWATVSWTTNRSSSSVVDYWNGSAVQTATGASGTSHSVQITGLNRKTTYSYRARSVDSAGTSVASTTLSFRTK